MQREIQQYVKRRKTNGTGLSTAGVSGEQAPKESGVLDLLLTEAFPERQVDATKQSFNKVSG